MSAGEEFLHQAKSTHTHSGNELNNLLIQREDIYPNVSYSSSLFYFHVFAWALQTDNDLLSPEVKEFHSVCEPLH